MARLFFEKINDMSLYNEDNIGGPPINGKCNVIPLTNLTPTHKKLAYDAFINGTGYQLFDYSKITNATLENEIIIVKNTSFFIFFTIFLVLFIFIFIAMSNSTLDYMVGVYLIFLFGLIIYIASLLYRNSTIFRIESTLANINQQIAENRVAYEQSFAALPIVIDDIREIISQ